MQIQYKYEGFLVMVTRSRLHEWCFISTVIGLCMTRIGINASIFLLWLERSMWGFCGLAYTRVSGAHVWNPAVVEWLQCRNRNVAGLYHVLP
jgi:hypothetical protein